MKAQLNVCGIHPVGLWWIGDGFFFASASPSNRRANSFVLIKLEQIASGPEPHQYGFTQLNFLIQTPLAQYFVHPVLQQSSWSWCQGTKKEKKTGVLNLLIVVPVTPAVEN